MVKFSKGLFGIVYYFTGFVKSYDMELHILIYALNEFKVTYRVALYFRGTNFSRIAMTE